MDDSVDEQTEKRSRPLAPWIVLVVAIALGGLFFTLASANPSSGATAE